MPEDGPKDPAFYQDALRRSVDESRTQRRAPQASGFGTEHAPATPAMAGYHGAVGDSRDEPVIAGAVGGNGIYQVNQSAPAPQIAGPTTASAPALEFALYDASSGGAPAVGVKFGNVSFYRSADGVPPYPSGFSAPDYKYEFGVSGMGYVWITYSNDTSGDFDKLASCSMGYGETVPDNDATTGYVTIGTYNVTGSPARVVILSGAQGVGNQSYNFAGGAHSYGSA